MAKITYANKETLNEQPSVAAKNKVSSGDMNEIKTVVNGLDDSITNLETYSTSETDTGKIWIDNKPIYRKVYTGTTTVGGAFTTIDSNFTYHIIEFKGNITNTDNNTQYSLVGENGSNGDFVFAYKGSGGLQLCNSNSSKTFDYELIVEYTK